jgi:hypothetical protein
MDMLTSGTAQGAPGPLPQTGVTPPPPTALPTGAAATQGLPPGLANLPPQVLMALLAKLRAQGAGGGAPGAQGGPAGLQPGQQPQPPAPPGGTVGPQANPAMGMGQAQRQLMELLRALLPPAAMSEGTKLGSQTKLSGVNG